MQSYQLHIISEQLKRRHPYLEAPFKARYDPTQVYKAVFDRAIPKLIQILLTEGLQPKRYASALITLNEIASDQAQKRNMINQGCVGLASAFAHCPVVSIRRQATLLLGLNKATNQTFSACKALLFDKELEVRQAVSWTICRIVLNRMGADMLCRQQIAVRAVDSFLKYSGSGDAKQQQVMIFLLQGFRHIFAYDNGIKVTLGKGLTARLKNLASTLVYSKQGNEKIHALALCALGNISMNPQGKIQCVNQNVIDAVHVFLQSSSAEEVSYTITLIMFTAINLKGKKQCIYNNQGKVNTTIITKIIKLLDRNDLSQSAKNDAMQALKIIAQERDGFEAIADYMANNTDITHIQKIFGSTIIVPLARLLLSPQQLTDAPALPSNFNAKYKAYAKTISHFLQQYAQAKQIALKECVDLVNKLSLFFYFRGDKLLQDGIAKILTILAEDQYSKKTLLKYIQKYGQIEHKICKTTFNAQLKRFPQLSKILGIQ